MSPFIVEISSHLEVIMMLIISCQKAHFFVWPPLVGGSWRTPKIATVYDLGYTFFVFEVILSQGSSKNYLRIQKKFCLSGHCLYLVFGGSWCIPKIATVYDLGYTLFSF